MPHVALFPLCCFHANAQGTGGGPEYSLNPYTGEDKSPGDHQGVSGSCPVQLQW